MQTVVKLFTPDAVPCATALREPSICLIECDAAFGLLIAQSSTDTSKAVLLERVSYLRVQGRGYQYYDLGAVILKRSSALWVAQDTGTLRYLPEPSAVPYSLLYLTREQHESLEDSHARNEAASVFAFCQTRFGTLPGFSYESNLLVTPDEYAVSGGQFDGEFFVPRAGS